LVLRVVVVFWEGDRANTEMAGKLPNAATAGFKLIVLLPVRAQSSVADTGLFARRFVSWLFMFVWPCPISDRASERAEKARRIGGMGYERGDRIGFHHFLFSYR
jgi:hypothetical protein